MKLFKFLLSIIVSTILGILAVLCFYTVAHVNSDLTFAVFFVMGVIFTALSIGCLVEALGDRFCD